MSFPETKVCYQKLVMSVGCTKRDYWSTRGARRSPFAFLSNKEQIPAIILDPLLSMHERVIWKKDRLRPHKFLARKRFPHHSWRSNWKRKSETTYVGAWDDVAIATCSAKKIKVADESTWKMQMPRRSGRRVDYSSKPPRRILCCPMPTILQPFHGGIGAICQMLYIFIRLIPIASAYIQAFPSQEWYWDPILPASYSKSEDTNEHDIMLNKTTSIQPCSHPSL